MKLPITQEWVDKVTKEEDTFPGANGPPSSPPKKFKFIRVRRDDFKEKPIMWMLSIETEEHLLEYLTIKNRSVAQAYYSAKKKNDTNVGHYTPQEFAVIVALERYDYETQTLNSAPRKGFIEDLMIVSDTFSKPFIQLFGKEGTLHVNAVGGFYPAGHVAHTILDTIEKDEFKFPIDTDQSKKLMGEGIQVRQWYNGAHFYAKIGDMDVVWKGEQKWDTYDEASKAASAFYESLKVKK